MSLVESLMRIANPPPLFLGVLKKHILLALLLAFSIFSWYPDLQSGTKQVDILQ